MAESLSNNKSMSMGFFTDTSVCLKRKFRWLLFIDKISGDGSNILPPSKSARPSVSFKEIEVQHVSETVFFPGKPEWKPLNVTLYDLMTNTGANAVFDYITNSIYDPEGGSFKYPVNPGGFHKSFIFPSIHLELYDGCKNLLEQWVYEDVWIQNIDFGDLDMSDSGIVMVELAMRYARAYIQY